MRLVLVAALVALASIAGLSPASASSASDRSRETGRSAGWSDNAQPRSERRRIARAAINDEDDDDARPRRQYGSDSYDAPRYTKRRQARSAKRARRHARTAQRSRRHAVRRTGRRTAERGSRRVRRAAVTNAHSYAGGSGAQGVASYYWQPQRLATGGWFNPDAMTAAHRTLPFGTRVRVTHMGNGRSVNVVINDRGPYIAGRIIDLSRGAAKVIGMTGAGLARIKMDVVGR